MGVSMELKQAIERLRDEFIKEIKLENVCKYINRLLQKKWRLK